MKNINISRNSGVVKIDVQISLKQNKKNTINSGIVEQKFNSILEKFKKLSTFRKLTIYYTVLDYMTFQMEKCETPYIHFTNGSNKANVSYQEHCFIPNEWIENVTLFLEDPKTIKPIEIFLSEFNIKLTQAQIREIRKSVKGLSICNLKI